MSGRNVAINLKECYKNYKQKSAFISFIAYEYDGQHYEMNG